MIELVAFIVGMVVGAGLMALGIYLALRFKGVL